MIQFRNSIIWVYLLLFHRQRRLSVRHGLFRVRCCLPFIQIIVCTHSYCRFTLRGPRTMMQKNMSNWDKSNNGDDVGECVPNAERIFLFD